MTAKPKMLRKQLFVLCFLHALLCVRRKFGALGYNMPYDFSVSDLQASALTLQDMHSSNELRMEGVTYMLAEVIYGGHVSDNKDRRFVLTEVNEVLAAREGVAFNVGGDKYMMPSDASGMLDSLEMTLKFVRENWPQEDDAAIFGLHAHADLVVQQRAATQLLEPFSSQLRRTSSIVQLQQQGASPAEASIADPLRDMVDEICGRLPAELDDCPPLHTTPMSNLLCQETRRFNKLLGTVRTSMEHLGLALQGFVVMSAELTEVSSALMSGRLPDVWTKCSYPSLKTPIAFIDDLLRRVDFFRGWIERGQPEAFWLPAFFFSGGVVRCHDPSFCPALRQCRN